MAAPTVACRPMSDRPPAARPAVRAAAVECRRPRRPLRRDHRRRRPVADGRRRARCWPSSGPTGPARPPPSRPSRDTAGPHGGPGPGPRPRPGGRPPRASWPAMGVMLQRGGVYPVIGPAPGPAALRRLLRRPRGSRGAAGPGGPPRAWPARRGGGCRAASSSGCRWPSPSWAGPRWSSSTSRPPASTPRAAWPCARSSPSSGPGGVRGAHHPRAPRGRAAGRPSGHRGRGQGRGRSGTVAELRRGRRGGRLRFGGPARPRPSARPRATVPGGGDRGVAPAATGSRATATAARRRAWPAGWPSATPRSPTSEPGVRSRRPTWRPVGAEPAAGRRRRRGADVGGAAVSAAAWPSARPRWHDPAAGRVAAAHHRDPGHPSRLLLRGAPPADRHRPAGDLPGPGILALAVMSTAMVNLGIATGFERGYGVLKRLGATPLGRPRCSGAKIVDRPRGRGGAGRRARAGRLRARLAPGGTGAPAGGGPRPWPWSSWPRPPSAGIGLLLAGVLRAEVNLAAANGLYLVLLLAGRDAGAAVDKLPGGLQAVAKALPAAALSDGLHAALGTGAGGAGAVVGRARGVGGGRPGRRRPHLPLGVSLGAGSANPM